jgi:hypothetical protein
MQVGEMCQKPGGRWLPFTAVEKFAVEDVGFSWRARFPIAPLVSLRVVDRYAAGEGLLEARLLGRLRVLHARGQEVSEGEALRYLAELAWVPHAILANRQLEWRALDAGAVEVATRVGTARVAARLEFDEGGDIVGRGVTRVRTAKARRPCADLGPAGSATTPLSAASGFRLAARCGGNSRTGRSPTGGARSPRSNSTLQSKEARSYVIAGRAFERGDGRLLPSLVESQRRVDVRREDRLLAEALADAFCEPLKRRRSTGSGEGRDL